MRVNLREYIKQKRNERLTEPISPEKVQSFVKKNERPLSTLFTYYECALMEVETKFKVLNQEYSLIHDRNPIESIKTRLKSVDSVIEKVDRYNVPLTLESIESNINDIAGVRVICSFPDDIYTLAECLLEQDDVTLIQKKDYIMNPKPTGYRSLHLIISVPIFLEHKKRDMKVEVQFRTIAMDFWASLEHNLRYKRNIPEDLSAELAEELLECASISSSLDIRMQNIRKRLSEDPSEMDDLIDSTQWL
ncbi:MAG: GTP pyrophosphokinase family protein [Firmicutes bacterium]|nr:GTP pyrophosphokinase family protein [Bacillota bacterium]